jgi:hypothetical protein
MIHPYDADLYYYDIVDKQGEVFYYIREYLQGVDEKWFIDKYMKSNMHKLLDHANPKFAAMPPSELIDWVLQEELGGEYKRGESWWGMLPMWAGHMYAHYSWEHNIASDRLVDILTFSDMERIYPALHQMGWDAASAKIFEEVLPGFDYTDCEVYRIF